MKTVKYSSLKAMIRAAGYTSKRTSERLNKKQKKNKKKNLNPIGFIDINLKSWIMFKNLSVTEKKQ